MGFFVYFVCVSVFLFVICEDFFVNFKVLLKGFVQYCFSFLNKNKRRERENANILVRHQSHQNYENTYMKV